METIGVLVVLAFCMELVDSSMGMLYGTVLSPVLILLGYDPKLVIPAILLSQAIGGFVASISHHKNGNANFTDLKGHDLKAGLLIAGFGTLASLVAAFVAVKIPKDILGTYIGIVVLIRGTIILFGRQFVFSEKKLAGLALFSAMNKSLSGGGYGPVVTSGQVILGRNGRNSIGVTTFAEAPICLAGFLVYLATKNITDWSFIVALCIGSGMAGIIGPFFTARFHDNKKLKMVLGVMTFILGALVLFIGVKA